MDDPKHNLTPEQNEENPNRNSIKGWQKLKSKGLKLTIQNENYVWKRSIDIRQMVTSEKNVISKCFC